MANHMVGVVYVFLISNMGKVLLMERQNTGYADGLYSAVSGHMEPGEVPVQAAVRELYEEVGVVAEPKQLEMVGIMQRPAAENGHERIDFFFVCERWSGTVTNREPQKCACLDWFSPSDFPQNTLSYVERAYQLSLDPDVTLWFDDSIAWENLLTAKA